MSWSWPLFSWGIGVGVVGVAGSYVIGRIARLGYDQRRAYAGLFVMSVLVGLAAAALPSAGLDIGFTAFVAVANFVVPLLVIPRVRRSTPHACSSGSSGSCGADACSTCPLGAQVAASKKL